MERSFSDSPEPGRTLPSAFYLCILLYVSLSGANPASAGTIVVSKDPGGDFSSIQEAVDNASAGDSIVVQSGIYRESLVVDKTLEIRSETRNSGDVAVSARDGLPVVAVSGDAAVGLSGPGLNRTGGMAPGPPSGPPPGSNWTAYASGGAMRRPGASISNTTPKAGAQAPRARVSFHEQISGVRPDMKRYPGDIERMFDQ